MVQGEEILNTAPLPGDDTDCLERFREALTSFSIPDEKTVKRPPFGFSKCPNRDVEEYFEFVAKVGKPWFKWEMIRPAFLWKLDQIISDMKEYESDGLSENSISASEEEELRSQRDFIMRKAAQFEGTPFTFQRLCELLTTPSRHYKRLDKFLRALEKNINVVTTVTEYGERVTGVDDYLEEDEERPRGIEQTFFIKENGSPVEPRKDEVVSDDTRPMNLSAILKDTSEASFITASDSPKLMEVDGEIEDTLEKEEPQEAMESESQFSVVEDGADKARRNMDAIVEEMEEVQENQNEHFESREQYNQNNMEEDQTIEE